jgi:hypothetical protein
MMTPGDRQNSILKIIVMLSGPVSRGVAAWCHRGSVEKMQLG